MHNSRYNRGMTAHLQAVREYFAKLNFEPEIADVYMTLHKYGAQTISEVARNSGVERTRLYRMMDVLTGSGLVEVEVQYKRSILRAAPISNLQILISEKEQELRELHAELKTLESTLTIQQMHSATTRVQFYQGAEGIKQMMWNETKAEGEVLAVLFENMQSATNASFFERWVRTCNQNGTTSRGIVGDNFIASQQKWYAKNTNERLAKWQSRYVSEDVFPIRHSTIVYDNVTAHYNWKGDQVFGVEIINDEIAGSQRQFFELLWRQAQDVDDVTGKSLPDSK